MIRIEDVDDPRLAPYRDIRERDLRGRGGRFIAEGEVVLRCLAASRRFAIESLLMLDGRQPRLASLINGLPPHVPCYVAPRAVIDGVAGFPLHRGVLAVGLRGEPATAAGLLAELGPEALVVGLIGLTNHDNVGGIFRNAAAFGADAVLLDATTCDPLYRKAIRVSVGGVLRVPFAQVPDGEAMLAAFEGAGFDIVALSPSGRESLGEAHWRPRSALLVGAEGPGLPEPILARSRVFAIPMAAGFDSLNVATASGIALYEATRARSAGR